MAFTINNIRPLLWPCPTVIRAGFGTLPADWFEGEFLLLWVNPNDYRRVIDRPGDAKAFADTGAGTISAQWTARVGFDVTITDGEARKLLLVQAGLSSFGSSSFTVRDYVRPEVSDIVAGRSYTDRLGRVEALEDKGGMVQALDGTLYCSGFDLRFREQGRRLSNH